MPLYKGEFNYKGETFTLYRHATSKDEAKKFMILEIAEKCNTAISRIFNHFNRYLDNHHITKIEESALSLINRYMAKMNNAIDFYERGIFTEKEMVDMVKEECKNMINKL